MESPYVGLWLSGWPKVKIAISSIPGKLHHRLFVGIIIDKGVKQMKRLVLTAVCMLGLTGLAHAGDPTQADAEKIVKSFSQQFIQAWNAKQPEQMVALFADDGWRITDDGPIVGKEALLKHWTAVFQVANLDKTYVDYVKVLGSDNIQGTGHWEATLRLPDQPPHSMTGFWVVTDTRQKDGSWKISMESYNVKMAPPPTKTQ
jgi:uncharacterized protein (TIGR02246 family)